MRNRGLVGLADTIEAWMTFHGIDPCRVLLWQPVEPVGRARFRGL